MLSQQKNYVTLINDIQPGPCLEIEICNAATNTSTTVMMKIDTGSSRTVIPKKILNEFINLRKIKDINCFDYNGDKKSMPLFVVNLKILGNTFMDREIIGSDNPEYGLIGRDILSQYILTCDGPKKKFELEFSQE
ncbi:MAG: hypothetical protein AB1656_14455 [Candidatus Omnitrophota bacterium]